jgi:hypothetical protein
MYNSLEDILINRHENLALIIGNGVNRVGINSNASWEDLLIELWNKYQKRDWLEKLEDNTEDYREIFFQGITLTEFYDLLELSSNKYKIDLQKEFCNLMKEWEPNQRHSNIVKWAINQQVPILTTNFENTFSTATDDIITKFIYENGFVETPVFPWNTCYKINNNKSNLNFGIWNINGFQEYPKSIRLSLSHYMQSIKKARELLHAGDDGDGFFAKNNANWKGSNTWLHIIFNCDLVIFGLALDSNEIFIRWLLIQRAKYFQLFNHRKRKGFYIEKKQESFNTGKKLFLESVGFQVIEEEEYEDIYNAFLPSPVVTTNLLIQ